ncbi:MAG: pitrilysin family protein [Alphaproteobacteria bacterium]|nr:pitrilysin family protein [Alphaproteobacteria bacterium]
MTISISKLKNGFTVISETISHVETAWVGIWADVGSRCEAPEDQGISHFLEHMAFKGTNRRTARQIAEEIERVGGCLNACTSSESTGYYASVLKEDVDLAVDILCDILLNSTFDTHELVREQKVVLQEISAVHDTPDDLVFDLFLEAAYSGHPLGWSILGTQKTVSHFTPDRLRAYLEKNYSASNMVLCAVGAVSHDELLELAERHISDFPSFSKESNLPAIYHGGERCLERDLEQVQFVVGLSAPCYHDKDFYVARLLSMIMGGGMSSRLFQEVREVRGLCYCISSFHWPFRDAGLFGIHAATGARDLPELSSVITGELLRIALDIHEDEVARARRQVRANLLISLESLPARADRLIRQMMLFGKIMTTDELLREIDAVTVKKLHELSENLRCVGQPSVATIGPVSNPNIYTSIAERLSFS